MPRSAFCGECGAAIGGADAAPRGCRRIVRPRPRASRSRSGVWSRSCSRTWSGFTALAEDRDPEAVRELLTRYFDLAREVIERYGGTVEKFIGDAVMAVWGAPVAREDDAERAVRAALDLVDVVRDARPATRPANGSGAGQRAHG